MNDSIAAISTIVFFIGCYFFKILIMPDNLFNTSFRVILALTSSHTLFRCVKYIINSKIGQLFSYIGMYTLEIYYIHSFLLRVVSIEPEEILFSYNALIKAGFMTIFMIIIIPIIIVLIKNNKILSLLIFGKRNRRG